MYKNILKPKLLGSDSRHTNIENKLSGKNLPVLTVAGHPNSGKTTLFNTLTGSHFKTANYPGATVEYHTGNIIEEYNFNATVVDSPGIISIHPESPDEKVTVDSLFHHPKYGLPDVVIVTTDCTQLSRQMYPVRQMIDSGFRVIVALTMFDLLEIKGLNIDTEKLSRILGVPVIIINSRTGKGIAELVAKAKEIFHQNDDEDFKNKIKKPRIPSLEEIMEMYRLTEKAEKEVIIPSGNIEGINRTQFGTMKRLPHEMTLKLDKVILHPFWGLLIFFFSMGVIFTSIFWLANPLMNLIDSLFGLISETASGVLPSDTWYNDLITKGLINGVGSVMVFVPQIIILFLFLALLEDTGYLARAAMLIDKPLTKFGLNGRSFVPMLSGYACAIPAILAARTITNRRERYLTIFIIPLMSCSARLPVYALLLAFITPPDKPWIAGIGLGAMYLLSLITGSLAAGLVSKLKKAKEKSTFMLELPSYRMPVFRHIIRNTFHKSFVYVRKAGPTIVLISLILWVITYFPNIHPEIPPEKLKGLSEEQIKKLTESERLNTSYAAMSGRVFEPVLNPLGWDWRIGVSLISAFAAREVFVSALAITLSITDSEEENLQSSIINSMHEAKIGQSGKSLFTTASVLALIIYFMIAMQCLSTVAVVRKETGTWRIPMLQIFSYTFMAYLLSFLVYNIVLLTGIS